MSRPGELEIVILGCGSSGGVPRGDGDWGDCDPGEPKNRRTRCSLLARRHGPDGTTSVLIDTSPDLRHQALAAGITHVDAVLYTHDHADQTHGIDDLRVFAIHARQRIQAWMDPATHHALTIDGAGGEIPVVTFDQAHGPIRSVGYRLGPVAYSSDVSDLDEAALEVVRGTDLWIIDALRYTPHPTHAHVDKALDWIARADVGRALLTNLHIDLDYNRLSASLPGNVEVAFDGWSRCFPA